MIGVLFFSGCFWFDVGLCGFVFVLVLVGFL